MSCKKHPHYKGLRAPTANCDGCKAFYAEQPEQQALIDVEETKTRRELNDVRRKDKVKDSRIIQLERELQASIALNGARQTYTIKPVSTSKTEAVAVVVASDFHIEEIVKSDQVSGLNAFNEEICQQRVSRFWRHTAKLLKKEQEGVKIDRMVLALLGDYISGSIHEDLSETNRVLPIDALIEAQGHLIAGIEYLLMNTNLKEIVVVCKSGNHGRATQKQRIGAEAGNSFEHLLYHWLRDHFKSEKRLVWVISEGYHSFLDIFGWVVRFHHGHAMRYYGSVSGITLTINRAVAEWNKARRADYDVFGHFHQLFNGPNFVCNGSLIGYNAYAVNIKASYEPPRQAFFLIDKDDGKTIFAPVILERDK